MMIDRHTLAVIRILAILTILRRPTTGPEVFLSQV